jgi:hypothetical protein
VLFPYSEAAAVAKFAVTLVFPLNGKLAVGLAPLSAPLNELKT